ncbi:MAG: HD domain-containing protein [Deltaproteobacteria bacterium]|nr:HD domain-containing protein [Deltaproteobacteria bacterium]
MPAFEEIEDPAIRVRERGGRLLVAGGAARDLAIRHIHGRSRPFPEGGDLDLVVFGLDLEGILAAAGSPVSGGPPARIVWRLAGDRDSRRTALVTFRRGGVRMEAMAPRSDGPVTGSGSSSASAFGGLESVPFSDGALAGDAGFRDFTVNALYFDPLERRFLDPLGSGLDDVRSGFVRPVSPGSIPADPVRMLRAMALVSRRPFAASSQLLDQVRASAGMLDRSCPERFWPEWRRAAEGSWPHLGLRFLEESGLIARFPELDVLRGLQQYHTFHPEGSVWNHTVLVVQAMSRLPLPPSSDRAALVMTALLHDVGKAQAARAAQAAPSSGMILYPDHAALGAPVARAFMRRVEAPDRTARAVSKLTARHMDSAFRTLTPGRLRWIARELAPEADLRDFWAICAADWNGRSPWPEEYPWSLEEFLEPVRGEAGPPADLVNGSELMASFGIPEGPEVGRLLKLVRHEHDEGRVDTREGALDFLAGLLRHEASGIRGFEPAAGAADGIPA